MTEDLFERFQGKVEELKVTLPNLKEGINCAELTLTSVLEVVD